MPRIKNFKDNFESRVPEVLKRIGWNSSYIKEKYNYKAYASPSAWVHGQTTPPVPILCDIAKEANTNLDYLLGATTLDTPNDNYTPDYHRLGGLLKKAEITPRELAWSINTYTNTVLQCIEGLEDTRINTLFAISDALGCSIDYLLGLTEIKSWAKKAEKDDPFYAIKPGEPAYIEMIGMAPNKQWSAPTRGYVLLSKDGESVIFPSGKVLERGADLFKKVVITPCEKAKAR